MSAHAAASPGKGSGLFASVAIPKGSSILTVPSPLIAIPDDAHLAETCASCMAWKPPSPTNTYYSSTTPLLQCAGCRVVKYCDQTCQRADWKSAHKKECKIFARLHPRVLPASVRALVRLLLIQPSLATDTWKAVIGVETHTAELRAAGKWDEISLMAKGAHAYSGTALPEPMVLRLYCAILVNTLTLTTPTLDPIGLCFHPLAASANHSCVPNASIIFSGQSLNLRSLNEIPKDTEITIPYIDITFPTATRQAELKSRWFFTCACQLCSQDTSAPTDLFSCTHCARPIPNISPLLCPSCHQLQPSPPESEDLNTLYHTRLFPLHRQPLPSLHATCLQSLLTEKNYGEALKHQLLLYTRINPALYTQPHHPVRVCAGFVLAALAMEVSRDPGQELAALGVDWGKAVWAVLSEVEQRVAASHGGDSTFAEVVRGKMREVAEELGRVQGMREEELAKAGIVVEQLLKDLRG